MLFPALLLLIFGGGLFKTNTIDPGGAALCRTAIRRRDSGYSIFYIGINLGAFLAPFVCGTLGEDVGWRWGFAAAGVGMLLALGVYFDRLAGSAAGAAARERAKEPRRTIDAGRNGNRWARCSCW